MSKKTETQESYSYNNNTNTNDFKESVNRSLDEAKDNIKRSIDESKNQIPKYNNIVNSYQEQSLQTAREISEEYIDSQKEIISSLQSAWRPINENYNSVVTSLCIPRLHSQGLQQVCQQCSRQHRIRNQTHKQHHILKPGLNEISVATGKGQLKTPVQPERKHGKNI